jgi:hypothetical protein
MNTIFSKIIFSTTKKIIKKTYNSHGVKYLKIGYINVVQNQVPKNHNMNGYEVYM